ncbi:hypothetical protein [Halobacteriovorax sp. DPLXC-1]|uniref:hypothetical protein n=1 Tax=Halobacteriovorax sp. DPLXC-1 TaxID=3110771 RepID=UPI002FF429C6
MVKWLVIITSLLVLTSCSLSEFQKNMVGFYKRNGVLKTYDKLQIKERIEKYKYNLFGKIRIYYDDMLISENCHFGFDNGNGTDGHLLNMDGRYVISSDQSVVYLRKLYCVIGDNNPRFKYLFKKKDIKLNLGNNVFNSIELYFVKDSTNDSCSILQNNNVSLDKVIVNNDYFKPREVDLKLLNKVQGGVCP